MTEKNTSQAVAPRALSKAHQAEAEARLDQLTKPRGSLGLLERVVVQLAGIQGAAIPCVDEARAILFAADHPVCKHGVSAYPSEVTGAMVANFVRGGAAASVLCRQERVPLMVVDVGVQSPVDVPESADGVVFRRVEAQAGVGDLRLEDALSESLFETCFDAGARAVDAHAVGAQLLVLGEMGIGNTTPAAAVTAALLDLPAEVVVGRGTGVNDAQRSVKVRVVADAVARVPQGTAPLEVLRMVGGRELVALAGAAARAAELGIAVLVDGYIVSSALLALCKSHPGVRAHLLFGHTSREPGHRAVLEALDARALVDLDMALGEGSGALVALPLVRNACALHAQMATFAEAAVPDKA